MVKVGVLFVPAGVKLTVPLVGTPAGQATVPAGVKLAVALVGTPAGQAIVPAGVIEETPPLGLLAASGAVVVRDDPPVAVDVIICVPVVEAVVPPAPGSYACG